MCPQESNQKYTFVTPDGKPGAVPVHSLIAREKPGSESPKVAFHNIDSKLNSYYFS